MNKQTNKSVKKVLHFGSFRTFNVQCIIQNEESLCSKACSCHLVCYCKTWTVIFVHSLKKKHIHIAQINVFYFV